MASLSVFARSQLGKKVKALRRHGWVPAILYGAGRPNVPLTVERKALELLWQSVGESSLFTLTIADTVPEAAPKRREAGGNAEEENVIIHALARDPLTDAPIHVDFYRVNMARLLRVSVPLEFAGESPAVSELGGVLVKNLHAVEVEALPGDIPRALTVNVSGLKTFEDSFTLADLLLPRGVKVMGEKELVVAAVKPPRSEAELTELGEKPVEAVAEVEVVEKAVKREDAEAEEAGSSG